MSDGDNCRSSLRLTIVPLDFFQVLAAKTGKRPALSYIKKEPNPFEPWFRLSGLDL